jgi:hypothetical protein
MFLTFSREGNGLGVGVLFMREKWLPVPSKGIYVNRSVL